MGIHVGILNFQRAPIDAATSEDLRCMLPTGSGVSVRTHSQRGLLMFEQAQNTSPASERCPVPASVVGDREVLMTWEGRLDNRDDLLLRLHGRHWLDQSDSAIVIEAYRRWGIATFGRLIGDWSLALWDEGLQTLLLACDYMSVRPLHYHVDGHSLMWSSQLRPLASARGCLNEISTEYVSALLVSFQSPMCATPFSGIKAVPAAHVVAVRSDGTTTVSRHWEPTAAQVQYQRRSAYEDALRAALVDAVQCRLRVPGAPWAELSGGIDSSSIVCIAHEISDAPRVSLLSQVSDDGVGGDERRFIRAIEEHTRTTSHYMTSRDCITVNLPTQQWGTPEDPFGARAAGLITVARHGGTTLLSGRVGDTVMWNNYDSDEALLEHLLHGSVRAFWRDLRKVCFINDRPLIDAVRKLTGSVLGWRTNNSGQTMEDRERMRQATLLRDELISEAAMATDNHWKDLLSSVPVPKRRLFSGLAHYSTFRLLRSPSDFHDVRYTYPYAHRPLIELVLAMPALEQWEPGQPRALMRRALAGIVPSVVLDRRAKGFYVPASMRELRSVMASWRPRVGQLEVVRRGWVDPAKLGAALTATESGISSRFWAVQSVIRLEIWLATLATDWVTRVQSDRKGGDTHVQHAAVGIGRHG